MTDEQQYTSESEYNKYNKINVYKIGSDDNKYEIFKSNKLGQGTYSTVYLGRKINNSDPQNFVAIKKIIKSQLSSKGLNMLSTEIEIINETMTHTNNNLIKCYDVIDDIDAIYIITEYCENGDLSTILTNKSFKYEFIVYYFGQIINGFKYLYENDIVHRDIKPNNVLVSDNKLTLKLCDFSFAKYSTGNLKKSMTMCGSPLYMAPEIYKRTGYSNSVDVWSLGLILYEMIYGMHPHKKYNDPKTLKESIINTDIQIVEKQNISDSCMNILKKMLQRNDYDRISLPELFNDKWIIYCIESYNTIKHSYMEDILAGNIYEINESMSEISSSSAYNSTTNEKELSDIFIMDD